VEYSILYKTIKVNGRDTKQESELLIWVVQPNGTINLRHVDSSGTPTGNANHAQTVSQSDRLGSIHPRWRTLELRALAGDIALLLKQRSTTKSGLGHPQALKPSKTHFCHADRNTASQHGNF
jgi:hypothetical protein